MWHLGRCRGNPDRWLAVLFVGSTDTAGASGTRGHGRTSLASNGVCVGATSAARWIDGQLDN